MRVLVLERDLKLACELLRDIDRSPYRGPVYAPGRVVDIAMMLLIAFLGVPPPARIPAEFYLEASGPPR